MDTATTGQLRDRFLAAMSHATCTVTTDGPSARAGVSVSAMTCDGRTRITRPLRAGGKPSRVVLATRKNAMLSAFASEFRAMCLGNFALPC